MTKTKESANSAVIPVKVTNNSSHPVKAGGSVKLISPNEGGENVTATFSAIAIGESQTHNVTWVLESDSGGGFPSIWIAQFEADDGAGTSRTTGGGPSTDDEFTALDKFLVDDEFM